MRLYSWDALLDLTLWGGRVSGRRFRFLERSSEWNLSFTWTPLKLHVFIQRCSTVDPSEWNAKVVFLVTVLVLKTGVYFVLLQLPYRVRRITICFTCLLNDQARLTMMGCVKCRLYYMALLLGTPSKLYFLDVDTGSDLTWLQCDAPCRSCAPVSEYYSALASCLS